MAPITIERKISPTELLSRCVLTRNSYEAQGKRTAGRLGRYQAHKELPYRHPRGGEETNHRCAFPRKGSAHLCTTSPSLLVYLMFRAVQPAVIEERNGEIEFRVVNNDNAGDSLIILTGLKCIFQKQLPKMPKDYIARLVYDRTHLSMAIVKKPLEVVG